MLIYPLVSSGFFLLFLFSPSAVVVVYFISAIKYIQDFENFFFITLFISFIYF